MVVEFDGGLATVPFGVAEAFGAHGATHLASAAFLSVHGAKVDLRVGRVGPRTVRVFEQGAEALAFGALVGRQAAEIGNRGVEVDQLGDAFARLPVGLAVRIADDEGHAGRIFVEGAFLPEAVLTEVVAVVADEDDDGVLIEALLLQFREHEAELRVHEGHRG